MWIAEFEIRSKVAAGSAWPLAISLRNSHGEPFSHPLPLRERTEVRGTRVHPVNTISTMSKITAWPQDVPNGLDK
jgi:hypothetical protein